MENIQISPEMMSVITTYATRLVGVIVALFVAWIVAGWVRRLTSKALTKAKVDLTLTKFFSNFAKYVVLTIAIVACLGVFGIQTTSFAAVLAAAGFAIGMAFQGTLSNFSAGVMLLVFRPFKVGQFIKAGGTAGTVFEIELFTTTLDTPDNRRIIVPNSAIFGATIENVSHHPIRRVDVAVGTDYGADVDETRKILERVAGAIPNQPSEKPFQIYLSDLGASSIDWAVRVWCKSDDYWAVKEQLTRDIKVALDEAGVGIPFPQMDVHFDNQFQAMVSNKKDGARPTASVN